MIKASFDLRAKSPHITNNVGKSFNNWIGKLRDKPIVQLVDGLTCKMIESFQKKYESWLI